MLKIKGEKLPLSKKPPFFSPKSTTSEKPLTRAEILESLKISNINDEQGSLKILETEELLEKIEQQANKVHEDLKKLRKSKENNFSSNKKSTNSHKNDKTPDNSLYKYQNNFVEAYDSDPEYNHYHMNSDKHSEYLNNSSKFSQRAHSFEENEKLEEEKEKIRNSEENEKNSKIPENLTYKDYATHEKNDKGLKFTIPKPFAFEYRETNKNVTISKRRFLEDLEAERTLKEALRKHQFKANSIPEHVKDKQLYDKLRKIEEDRRLEVKKNSKILTLQREKPFSFYLRDLKKPKKTAQERKQYKMKASPIPWYCSVPLLQRMQDEEEAQRRERVAKEAQLLMSISHLPSRMEKHEQEKKAKELKGIISLKNDQNMRILSQNNPNLTFQPAPRKIVPDFHRLQSAFQAVLDRKRSNKRPIIPVPFNFEVSKKPAQKRDYLNEENMLKKTQTQMKEDPIKQWRKLASSKPKYQPPSTKKWEQAYEFKKKERETKENNINEIKKQELEKERKRKEIEMRVKGSPAIVDNTIDLKEKQKKMLEARKNEIKKTEQDYKRKLEEIKDNVRKRLLLVENYEEGSRKARKRKLNEKKEEK